MKTLFARPLLAALLAGSLIGGPNSPAFAQDTPQKPTSSPAAPSPSPQGSSSAPITSLGVSKHDFSRGPRAFPNLIKPYQQINIEAPTLTNAPRIDQLIHDGKLEISLQDAVELALENSLDIAVQRYYPWIADVSLLKTHAGGFGYGTPGSISVGSTANLPELVLRPFHHPDD